MSHSSGPNQGQYHFIAELLERQNDVLNQIDHLNERIEAFIQEIGQDRRSERERQFQIDANSEALGWHGDSDEKNLGEAA